GVFSNFSDLGLIILDEEEDASYKSRDTMPYYQTKDVALKLAELFSANVIFGSVVPSVESYKNFEVARLNDIETKKPILVDMRNEVHGGNYSILSYQLQEKLENVINGGKKAVLFISRKGSETFVFCRDCGYVEKCPNCDASLIHHEGVKSFLACHYCGFKKDLILKCPKCQSHRIKYFGAGTQKSKEEILKLWPEAKIGILDSDFAPTQKEQKEVFDGFKNGNINILVGTQLLFKKYDLLKVELAAVLSMDNLLYLPDFRSGERIFQVASRISFFCGKNSDFIIQTYTPENPIFEIIKNMDYEKFYKNEIQSRETFGYPPFSSLIKLIYKNKDRKIAELEADRLTSKIEKLNLKNIRILGPAPAYIPKVKNNYIWQVIVKIKNTDDPKKEKDLLLKNIPEGWIIDVNPESLL
ncbi:primosomal protein N', partial [Candidatus Azambacteria bacterium]|nr:primosomal protein N' [Candidatus Azambacteria bacterium]